MWKRVEALFEQRWFLLTILIPSLAVGLWLLTFSRSGPNVGVLAAAWCVLGAFCILDRKNRFTVVHQAAVGAVLFVFLKDGPYLIGLRSQLPAGLELWGIIGLTGMLIALPAGRRGPAAAALTGGILATVWTGYWLLGRHYGSLGVYVQSNILPRVIFLVLGALLAEKVTRRSRGDDFQGASGTLWGFVLGSAFTLLLR